MELLNSITYEVTLIGKTKKDDWENIKFNIRINGQDFDYSIGMGYVKTMRDYGYLTFWETKARKDGYTMRVNLTAPKKSEHHHPEPTYGLVKKPDITHVLNCLFSDSEAHKESFQDWCSNFGYNDDSIKAKNIYNSCIEEYFKLKKALGEKFDVIKSEIEKLEL